MLGKWTRICSVTCTYSRRNRSLKLQSRKTVRKGRLIIGLINTRSGKIGTYRQKSAHGVVTVYFHNKKLRDILLAEIEKIKELGYYAKVR